VTGTSLAAESVQGGPRGRRRPRRRPRAWPRACPTIERTEVRLRQTFVPALLVTFLLAACGDHALAQVPEIPHELPVEHAPETKHGEETDRPISRESGHFGTLVKPHNARLDPIRVLWKATQNSAGAATIRLISN
jgi:hypothetical protein